MEKVTYMVMGFFREKPGENPPALIHECLNGNPVNSYIGYDRQDMFHLYPQGRIIPSVVELKKKVIRVQDTKRGF